METVTRAVFRPERDGAARDRRDCEHVGTPHRHGTRVAYVTDQCRCIACRAANRAEERERTNAVRNGCWQPFVDAEPARTHLKILRQHGVGLDQIVKITQTPKATVRRVLGQSADRASTHPCGNRGATAGNRDLCRTRGAAEPGGRHRDSRADSSP